MIFSAIAGWFVKKLWPTGIILVALITIANAVIQFLRDESVNSNLELVGLAGYPNDTTVVLGAAAIDFVINLAIFLIVWALRRKLKPHSVIDSPTES